MIGLLILAQQHLGRGLLEAAEHTLGRAPAQVEALEIEYDQPPERIGERIAQHLRQLDTGDGVLILADVFGATHTNVALREAAAGHIEIVAGVNLPMLLRVLNYRALGMDELIGKAISGGSGGIVRANRSPGAVERG